MAARGPMVGEDELGVRSIETPHHCWKDARIKELEEEVAGLRGLLRIDEELRALAGKEVDGG